MRSIDEFSIVRRFDMLHLIYYFSLVFALTICVAGLAVYAYHARDSAVQAWNQVQQLQNEQKHCDKKITLALLRDSVDDENQIVSLRDYVYRKSLVGAGDFDYRRPIDHLLKL